MPLDGIRVLELTLWVQGPLCGQILGDLGAEVIKVEMPVTGDHCRGARSFQGANFWMPDGRNALWEIVNRNKKSITLDLHSKGGQEILYRLVKKADVFFTNLNPDGLKSMGATREDICKHNPKIIYARGGGFGQNGPDANMPCQDTSGMARSGFMFNSPAEDGSPTYVTGTFSDLVSGTMLAFGIAISLLTQERQGVSRSVYASQLSAMMWLQSVNIGLVANGLSACPRFDRKSTGNPLVNLYKCGDGKWIALGLYITDRFWSDFCKVMGLGKLEKDPKFEIEAVRKENNVELINILDGIFLTKPRSEWAKTFKEKRFWFSVINRVEDLLEDVQVKANDYIVELDNGLKFCARPFDLEGYDIPLRRGAPELGQNTEEVLTEMAGYSWEEVVRLKDKKII